MPRVRRCKFNNCHSMVGFPNHYCAKHFEHEAEYLARREQWNEQNRKQYNHTYNTRTRYRNSDKKEQYNFYRTKQWQGIRQGVLDRQHYLCQYCIASGIVTQGNTVDHTVPIEVDNSQQDNAGNLQVICRKCHGLKTKWEQNYYGTGKDNNLKNVKIIDDVKIINFLMR